MKVQHLSLLVLATIASVALMAQESITLEAYRQAVINYNQQVKVSRESTLASIANQKSSKSAFLPRIELQGQANLDLTSLDQFNAAKGSYHPYNYNAAFVLVQPIINGSVNDQYKVDKLTTQINQILETNVSDNISYQADVIYWTTAANKEFLIASEQYLADVKQLYKSIQLRYNEKYIAKNDLLMVNTRLKEAELQQKKAQTQYEISVQQFAILMGKPIDSVPNLAYKIDQSIGLPPRMSVDDVLAQRSDYKAAQLQVSLQENIRDLTLEKYNPYLGISVSAGYGTSNPNLGYKPQFLSLAQLNLRIPIIDFGERAQTRNSGQSAVNISKLQKELLSDQVNQEVNAAWTKVTQTQTQIQVATENLDNADQSLELNTFSYNEGKISIVDVLQSQISWIQAYGSKISAYLSYKISLADYNKALGVYSSYMSAAEK